MSQFPRNKLKREERVARWNKEAAQGGARRPRLAEGKKAKWDWIDSIRKADAAELSSTVRHVAVMLALHGDADGTRIYPTIRTLAAECNLSTRAVSASISSLVRCGRLKRGFRGNGAGAGAGFEYALTIPTVLTDDQRPVCTKDQHHDARVYTQDQHPAVACTDGQHGVHPGSHGVHPGNTKVCTDGASTSPLPIHIPGAGAAPAAPGDLANARPARRKGSSNLAALDPPEERVRKVKVLIAANPQADDETLAKMVRGLQPEDIRKARVA